MLKNRTVLAGAALGVAALVVGCGSSTKSTSSGTSAGSSAATKSPIPIGLIGAWSGPFASSIGSSKLATQAWADSVNAAGGINGHPIKLYVMDDGGVSATSVTMVKQLVEEDHVVALVGEQSTPGDDAWASYVQGKGIPVVGGNADHLQFLKNPDFYAASGNLLGMFYGVSAQAATHNKKWGILYCAELSSCAGTATIMSAFTSATGVAVSYQGKVAASASDFTAQCQGLKDAGVGSFTLALSAVVNSHAGAQCKQQGVTAPNIFPSTANNLAATDPGLDGSEGVDLVYPFFDESIPAAKEMHDAFRKYEPSIGTEAQPLNGSGTLLGWTAGKLFEAAVKASGSDDITAASIKQGLYALKGETLGGLVPPLTFKEGQANLFNCYWTYKIENGKWVGLNDNKYACGPDSLIDGVASKF